MIAEFSIVPLGNGVGISEYVAECIKIVKRSGLDFELTPMGTIIQGDHETVMLTISLCHKRVAEMSDRVITHITIDDRRDERPMRRKVESVLDKI
ncbi:MAG: MTH1187 family thiamine-binding protein [Methanomassiliicoccales archaeon]|nr:MAG: MTH1187 family thiamine-binding protein [Methanomassiliicoccales archaeon]